jgi:hypothetical protein
MVAGSERATEPIKVMHTSLSERNTRNTRATDVQAVRETTAGCGISEIKA